ncbi:MAG: hypothetical protein K2J80_00320 [Oscillospiraceae bacterium]|nr:hypothetical protein [Oscillospiraceae bacterium]
MIIKPLVGVDICGKELRLGASENEIRSVLGEPYSVWENSLYYFKNELRFDLENGSAEFIEFLGGIDGELQPMIYGTLAFQTGADKLFDILAEKNRGEIDDSENGYSYGFLEISVGVYRETVPEDVRKIIEDAEEDGEPLDDEEIAEEMRRASHWDTIGIGIANYYGT